MKFLRSQLLLTTTLLSTIFATTALPASTYKVLHDFVYTAGDGYGPEASLVFDSLGNLYGTTVAGGIGCEDPQGCGIVFKLSPNGDGTWSETALHEFNITNGMFPAGPVVFDSSGNLYSTTVYGGSSSNGTAFKLTPVTGGWNELVLYSFTGGSDGGNPYGGVILDSSGHLYGTTYAGGSDSDGVAYQITTSSVPAETVLHSFGSGSDGSQSYGSLVADASGNLYGTTWAGGSDGLGTVFKLTHNAATGTWTETVLHSFTGSDGANPYAGVTLDASGNLYGTTYAGGANSVGTVFKLTNTSSTWSESVLHSFGASGSGDGGNPYSGVVFDSSGNLYGATNAGGGTGGHGTVYRLSPGVGGSWSETILHTFTDLTDGWWPVGGVILDSSGNIYGTTDTGGTGGLEQGGVVFEVTP